MDIIANGVKSVKIKDEVLGVRMITIETTKGDYILLLRKSNCVKRLNVKRVRG